MARLAAIILLTAGTVLAALSAANAPPMRTSDRSAARLDFRSWWGLWEWRYGFVGAVVLLGAGSALNWVGRRSRMRDLQSEADTAEGGAGDLIAPLRLAVEETRGILRDWDAAESSEENWYAAGHDHIRARLEQSMAAGCVTFANQQAALLARLGQAGYTEVMGAFAGGERRLNRAVSALIDDYPHEALCSLREALPHLEAALAALQARTGRTAPAA